VERQSPAALHDTDSSPPFLIIGLAAAFAFFGMADYRKLRVWQKADAVAEKVYELSGPVKQAGHADLADQMKRSVGSIPNNIAEGSGHRSRKEYARYIVYSIASTCELEGQISFARKIHAIAYSEGTKILEELVAIRKMLTGLLKKLTA
jgi:four helix bundle protein